MAVVRPTLGNLKTRSAGIVALTERNTRLIDRAIPGE
jgi:hypothetical protein